MRMQITKCPQGFTCRLFSSIDRTPIADSLPMSDRNAAAIAGNRLLDVIRNESARERGSVSDTVRHFGFV